MEYRSENVCADIFHVALTSRYYINCVKHKAKERLRGLFSKDLSRSHHIDAMSLLFTVCNDGSSRIVLSLALNQQLQSNIQNKLLQELPTHDERRVELM